MGKSIQKAIFKTLLLIGGLSWAASSYSVVTVSDIDQLKKISDEIDANTCVIWDIHYTLTQPKNNFLSWAVYSHHKDIIDPFLEKWSKTGKLQEFLDLLLVEEEAALTDPFLPPLINSLHKKGAAQFGVTSLRTGSLGTIATPTIRTKSQLEGVGIDLTRDLTTAIIKEMQTPGLTFHGGVAFTGGGNHFLKALAVYQLGNASGKKKVYLFDDQEKFLVDMEKWFDARVGFEFFAIKVDLKEKQPSSPVDKEQLTKYWQSLDVKFNSFALQS